MAAGSTTTYGGWEPRVCCLCDGRIVKSDGRSHRFHTDDLTGQVRSWHVQCEDVHGWPRAEGVAA
jgi:hypothetical protein